MELRHLYDTREEYVGDPVFFTPYGDVEGSGFGEGQGTVTGDRMNGTVRWVNHPRRREDDVWCPNITGRITTDDGGDVLYRMRGYSVVRDDGDGRDITASVRFTTGEAAHAWLNTVVGIVEGRIAADARRIHMRVYECVHELTGE